ncbi:hypothetical protein [Arthrobacter sp. H20]|uniref:hypothetical protein n=1 Tax=Arthrobacter sp. H20 TaxID=1267981 RepID=UPI000478B8BA|nr:hypothetical protein [Arthrobacter sp. H20]
MLFGQRFDALYLSDDVRGGFPVFKVTTGQDAGAVGSADDDVHVVLNRQERWAHPFIPDHVRAAQDWHRIV